jgi:hypothetical protein
LIIDKLEEAISLFDLYNHVPSLRAAAAAVQACKRGARCSQMLATTPVGSTLAGLILAVMAVQLIVGRTQPVFPHFIMTRRLPTNQLLWVGARAIHVLKYLEKLIHPRWPRTFEVAKRAVGVMVLLLTAVLLLTPVPLSNVVPAMVISLIALAYVEQDGLFLSVQRFGEQSSAQSLSAPNWRLWREFVHQLRPFIFD